MKITFLIAAVFLLSGCADSVTYEMADTLQQVGFWHGLWHGFILPFSWFISIYNNGGWYDFGFVLGISAYASID
jgi:hypothetical protein